MKGLSGLFALLLLLGTLAACGGSDPGNGGPEPPVTDGVPPPGGPEMPDGGNGMNPGMDSLEHHGGPESDSTNGHGNGDP